MTLQRVAIPSPNYSSGRARSRLLVVHTSEGATTFQNLGNYLANPAVEVSYQCAFDNETPGAIGVYVHYYDKAWAAHSANNEGEHGCCCTPGGASSGWSTNDWMARPVMLENCAAWLAEESARYGIPLKRINGATIAAGGTGVCDHHDCVEAGLGGNHTDVGPTFPWDHVLALASGGALPEEDDVEHGMLVDVVHNPNNPSQGYQLDRWGGIHPFGGAPKATGGPWWQGQDVARKITVIDWSKPAGYVWDLRGGAGSFGGAPKLENPKPSYWGSGKIVPFAEL